MKRMKLEKGITLIALIITIVILLILAVVTIGAVNDSNIIVHAQNAATTYNKAQTDEMTALDNYAEQIKLSQPQIGAVKDQDGNELAIGQFIKYGEKYYVVLYNDDTEGLQIVSTELKDDVTLTGIEGFENRIQILNDAANKYKGDVSGAIEARVLGYTFNEIENLELKDTKELIKNDGITVKVEIYGRASNMTSTELQNFSKVVQSVMEEGITTCNEDYWRTTYYNPIGGLGVQYIDVSELDTAIATLVEYDTSTKVITAENSITNKILPVFLLDQRIEITSGSGTYEEPYVYEF